MQAVIASIFSLEFQIAQLLFYWPDTRNTFTLACILVGENYSSEVTSSNGPPKKRIYF